MQSHGQMTLKLWAKVKKFYHNIDEISDLSQSETLNLVRWRARIIQPMTLQGLR